MLLILMLATAPPVLAQSPAKEAYDAVSVYRDRHAEVIWRDAEASTEALRAILVDLDRGLALLDQPLNRDLAEGSLTLHYRRYNFLVDKVKVHARLGETDAALDALEALQRIGWHPGALDRLLEDPHVATLAQTPRFMAARQREALATRLAEAPAIAGGYRDTLSPAARVAGLSRLWSEARDGFVWFDQVPELDWDQAYLDHIPEALAAADTEAYYRVLMRFAALLEDGHSNVQPPQVLHARMLTRPPLRTAWISGEVVVLEVGSRVLAALGVAVGDVVLTIDDEDVHAYAARAVAPFIGASTPQDRAVRVYDYRLLAGAADTPVMLRLRKTSGDEIDVRVPRNGYGRIEPPPTETFELRDDGIAVLVTRQFGSDAALRLFEEHLDDIMAARGLILDLRGNGGGSTTHGWDILTWLDVAPLQGTSSRHRVSDALDRARSGTQSPLRWRDLGGEPYRQERPAVYRGPVAMLIDARTYSAAEDTAAAFRLMRRGTIIGEPSGGSTGQPLFLALPGGGSARICVKRDEYPDGTTFVGVGVLPDIEVRTTLEDIRGGRDPVLARALAHLLEVSESAN